MAKIKRGRNGPALGMASRTRRIDPEEMMGTTIHPRLTCLSPQLLISLA